MGILDRHSAWRDRRAHTSGRTISRRLLQPGPRAAGEQAYGVQATHRSLSWPVTRRCTVADLRFPSGRWHQLQCIHYLLCGARARARPSLAGGWSLARHHSGHCSLGAALACACPRYHQRRLHKLSGPGWRDGRSCVVNRAAPARSCNRRSSPRPPSAPSLLRSRPGPVPDLAQRPQPLVPGGYKILNNPAMIAT